MGACRASASATTSSWAPFVPAPHRIVTAPEAFRSAASRSISPVAGTRRAGASRGNSPVAAAGAGFSATSPGTTITATPPSPIAVRIARWRSSGICSGVCSISQKWLHSRNSSVGWVS